MALIFECNKTYGIAELSYLAGDDSTGVAAVFDPRPDVDCCLQLAREKQVSITHIFETHIHVDFVSGARELCARGESAKIFLGHEGGARYDFAHEPIHDGDVFTFGSVLVTFRHASGHTPELVAYLLAEEDTPDASWNVLTGDSLFVSSAGRPDLLGRDQAKKLAGQPFHTLRDLYLKLADGVIIYPAHVHGSPCGADIGDRLSSTSDASTRSCNSTRRNASPVTLSPPRRPRRLTVIGRRSLTRRGRISSATSQRCPACPQNCSWRQSRRRTVC